MKIEVNNFMGCAHAEVKANNIALISGYNHQGKTSLLTAISSALTGQAVPLGLKKAECGMLVKIGTAKADVKVTDEQSFDSVSISWPKAELETNGTNPPATTKMAAGLEDIIGIKDKERSEFIRQLLQCDPTKEDLVKFLEERNCTNEKLINAVWTYVEQDGFDASHKRASDTGRALKSQWSDVTGEAYGCQKAETWQPTGWNSDLIGLSRETLETQLTAARAELEDMIARQAVDTSKMEEYKELADENALKIARDNAKICRDNTDQYRQELNDINQKIAQLSKKVDEQFCPHCGKLVQVVAGKVKPLDLESKDNTAEIKNLTDKIEELNEIIKDYDAKYLKYNEEVAKRTHAVMEMQKFKDVKSGTVTANEIDLKRNQIQRIEENIRAFQAKTESDRLNKNIKENQIIIDALDMSGIRKKSTENGLNRFNEYLKKVCDIAGWAEVKIENDMTITFAGRPYVLLSESEKYRVKITLQVTIARLQNVNTVVMDGAEILDKFGKNGLFQILIKFKLTAFIGMMFSDMSKVPNMSKFGVKGYWIENGQAKEI